MSTCVFIFALVSFDGAHAEWTSKGEVAFEGRAFTPDKKTDTTDWGLGLFARLGATYKWEAFDLVMGGFGRADRADSGRTFVAFEDTYIGLSAAGIRFRAGWQVAKWGALEFFVPTDIINSRNFDSDVESKEKFGELMVSLSSNLWEGSEVEVFWMPRFENPKIPSHKSRLSFLDPSSGGFATPVYIERTGAIASDKWNSEQGGARFNQHVGDLDFGLQWVYHMDRHQPQIVTDSSLNDQLRPAYFPVMQFGAHMTWVISDLVVKAEGAFRNFNNPSQTPPINLQGISSVSLGRKDHFIGAVGLEYLIGHESGWESTLFVEGINIFATTKTERQTLQIFQRDMIAGYHLALNNQSASEFRLAVIFDVESINNREIIYDLEYKQRLTDVWKFAVGVRFIDAPQQTLIVTQGLQALDKNGFLYGSFTRSF